MNNPTKPHLLGVLVFGKDRHRGERTQERQAPGAFDPGSFGL